MINRLKEDHEKFQDGYRFSLERCTFAEHAARARVAMRLDIKYASVILTGTNNRFEICFLTEGDAFAVLLAT